jgi:carboxymethylenebutenolidase
MDWLIPGVPATGRRVEVGLVGIIKFENRKISGEHLYWGHASVLAQLGVINQRKKPVMGVESPRALLDWAGIKVG